MIKLEDRVTKLEHEMVEVRRDVALRTELRGHIKTLEALRKTQLEQDKKISQGIAEMREGFAKINLGMAQMTALLNIAIGRDPSTD